MGNGVYEKFASISGHVCNGFFSIGEDVSEPEELSAFVNYLEDINVLKKSFLNSEIIHVPRMQNSKADSLARTVRKHTSFAIYMDAELPIWSTEPV